jgi:hypothetical protein
MSCLETYATLRIFSADLTPDVISERLGVAATEAIPRDPASKYKVRREANFWGWSTEGRVESTDNQLHVRAILAMLEGKAPLLRALRASGCEIDVSNYWVSNGQGGPNLEASDLDGLSSLSLPIWWDVYFGEQPET